MRKCAERSIIPVLSSFETFQGPHRRVSLVPFAPSYVGRQRFTDDVLLDAAHTAIDEHGVNVFTFRQVAAIAGCSPALLIERFRTKEGLLRTIAQRATDRYRSIEIPHTGNLQDCIEHLSQQLVPERSFPLERKVRFGDLAELQTASAKLSKDVDSVLNAFEEVLQRFVASAVKDGLVDGEHEAVLSRVLFHTFLGVRYLHRRVGGGHPQQQVADALIDVCRLMDRTD